MGKERFVAFSVATSVAATQEGATQSKSMLEAAMTAILPTVGQCFDQDQVGDAPRFQCKVGKVASAQD